jgi:hypothetical protein
MIVLTKFITQWVGLQLHETKLSILFLYKLGMCIGLLFTTVNQVPIHLCRIDPFSVDKSDFVNKVVVGLRIECFLHLINWSLVFSSQFQVFTANSNKLIFRG